MSTPAALSRTTGLARFNLLLMVRNRTTMLYGFVIPLVPLALLFAAPEPTPLAGVAGLGITLVMALLFPGYYNLLSMFVTRRDELVLKRLRTGEVRDAEIVTSMALPGVAIILAVTLLSIPIAAAAGFDLPLNPLLLLLGVLVASGTFAALAVWTASWTRTAEAAQLTSGPVMIVALAGMMAPAVPDSVAQWLDYLPGAAINDLVRVAWFGVEPGADEATLGFLATWGEALPALGLLLAWAVVALLVARRSLRWEPRA
ncbi:ABC transporter permease [Nocardioides daphniae]|uniref:ABC transporter permease n=1 Tax=Nocardioides daphniae TaxID=402297 RepID=A0A4P7UDP9_9ACTN|nr:ABC transporter permease [Nocardioides daphniae]QCC78216.1 ABC transporter permease [Nocardioides daphniae]GGD20845.1 transport permease protein [Nocardioides daphniae]